MYIAMYVCVCVCMCMCLVKTMLTEGDLYFTKLEIFQTCILKLL